MQLLAAGHDVTGLHFCQVVAPRSIEFFDRMDEPCDVSDGVTFPKTAIPTAGSASQCSGATSMRRRISPCFQKWVSFLNGVSRSPIQWDTLPINSYCRYAADRRSVIPLVGPRDARQRVVTTTGNQPMPAPLVRVHPISLGCTVVPLR